VGAGPPRARWAVGRQCPIVDRIGGNPRPSPSGGPTSGRRWEPLLERNPRPRMPPGVAPHTREVAGSNPAAPTTTASKPTAPSREVAPVTELKADHPRSLTRDDLLGVQVWRDPRFVPPRPAAAPEGRRELPELAAGRGRPRHARIPAYRGAARDWKAVPGPRSALGGG
jgi:hypothetical protein